MVSSPVDDHFIQILKASEIGEETFWITFYGKPFTANGFGHRMRKWRSAAVLPEEISAHGVSKSIGTLMAEADCSHYLIMAVHGRSDRLCCTNHLKDSLFESSVIAGWHEQLVPYEVPDKELAFI